jgi:hypothetical protein
VGSSSIVVVGEDVMVLLVVALLVLVAVAGMVGALLDDVIVSTTDGACDTDGEYDDDDDDNDITAGDTVWPLLQCAGVMPHHPNSEQHFPLAQIPLPRSPPPLPQVPPGFTMTSSAVVGVVVVVDCAWPWRGNDVSNADRNRRAVAEVPSLLLRRRIDDDEDVAVMVECALIVDMIRVRWGFVEGSCSRSLARRRAEGEGGSGIEWRHSYSRRCTILFLGGGVFVLPPPFQRQRKCFRVNT